MSTAADGQNYEDTEEKKVLLDFILGIIMLQSTLADKKLRLSKIC